MFCPKCGTVRETRAPQCANCSTVFEQAPETKRPASSGNPPIITETIAAIRAFFTKSPEQLVNLSFSAKSHMWAIFAGILALLAAFGSGPLMRIPILGNPTLGTALQGLWSPMFVSSYIIWGIILMAAQFAAMAGAILLLHTIRRVNFSFVRALNLVGVASIPLSAGLLFVATLGHFATGFSSLVVITALIAYVVILAKGVEKSGALGGVSLIWNIAGMFMVSHFAFQLVNSIAATVFTGAAFMRGFF